MNKSIYYNVKLRLILNLENGDLKFSETEESFQDESPILAREKAFEKFQSYVDVLLEHKGKNFISDEETRSELENFIELDAYEKLNKHPIRDGLIGVFIMPKDILHQFSNENYQFYSSYENAIHVIGLTIKLSPDNIMNSLKEEFKLYRKYGYDVKNYKRAVEFFGSTSETGEPDLKTYEILQTPFDWSKYKQPNEDHWPDWEVDNIESDILDKIFTNYKDLINRGETDQIEFKSTLLFNQAKNKIDSSAKYKVAKAICAFSNSKGGYLFIGVDKNKNISGIENDYGFAKDQDAHDFFRLSFDDTLKQYLEPFVLNSIESDLTVIDGKDVFVVKVFPSNTPAFVQLDKERTEFYIRGTASSINLTNNPQKMIKYCLDRWGNLFS